MILSVSFGVLLIFWRFIGGFFRLFLPFGNDTDCGHRFGTVTVCPFFQAACNVQQQGGRQYGPYYFGLFNFLHGQMLFAQFVQLLQQLAAIRFKRFKIQTVQTFRHTKTHCPRRG